MTIPRKVSFKRYIYLYFMYMFMCLPACMFMHHVCTVPKEARKGCWIPWNWNYSYLWAAMWVLGIEPGPSGRPASSLNHWASLQPQPREFLILISLSFLYSLEYLIQKQKFPTFVNVLDMLPPARLGVLFTFVLWASCFESVTWETSRKHISS